MKGSARIAGILRSACEVSTSSPPRSDGRPHDGEADANRRPKAEALRGKSAHTCTFFGAPGPSKSSQERPTPLKSGVEARMSDSLAVDLLGPVAQPSCWERVVDGDESVTREPFDGRPS